MKIVHKKFREIDFYSHFTSFLPWTLLNCDSSRLTICYSYFSGQYEMGECVRSGFCNFMHLKPISRDLRRELYGRRGAQSGLGNHGREKEEDKKGDKKRRRSRSRSRERKRSRSRERRRRSGSRDRAGRSGRY